MPSPICPRPYPLIPSPLLYPRQYPLTSPIHPRPDFLAPICSPTSPHLARISSPTSPRQYAVVPIPSAHLYDHMPSPRFPRQYPLSSAHPYTLTHMPSPTCPRPYPLTNIPSPHTYALAPTASHISPPPSYYALVNIIPSPRSLRLYPLTHAYPLSSPICISSSPNPTGV